MKSYVYVGLFLPFIGLLHSSVISSSLVTYTADDDDDDDNDECDT